MANRLLEKLKYPVVKVMSMLTLSAAPVGAAAQHTSAPQHDDNKTNTEVLQNSSLETGTPREIDLIDIPERGKTNSIDSLQTVPWVISNEINTEYVMNLKKWRDNGDVEIKRAYKDQVLHDDLTTVTELRESYSAGDAVNLNKSHTRMFICQGNTICGKDFVRMLYFSQNEALHNFAAMYIGVYRKPQQKSSPQTAEDAVKKIKELLYDEHGNLKLGKEGRKERREAFLLMRCFSTRNINTGAKFTNNFIEDFKKLDGQYHDALMQAEKEYTIGFYPLESNRNIPAQKAAIYTKKHGLRNASCIPVGNASFDISALIAHGPNSMSGFSPRDKNETKQFKNAARINKTDYITLECVRQMALAGYDGALDMYNSFCKAINEDRTKIEERGKALITPDIEAKPDAVKRPPVYILKTPDRQISPSEMQIRINKLQKGGR